MSVTPVTLNGTAGHDDFAVQVNGPDVEFFLDVPETATPTASVPLAELGSVSLVGNGGGDSLTVDESGGDPITPNFNFVTTPSTPGGTPNAIHVIGLTNGAVAVAAGSVTVGSSANPIATSNIDDYDLFPTGATGTLTVASSATFGGDVGASASVAMTVNTGATATFKSAQHLSSLIVASGGSVVMPAWGGLVLATNTLSNAGRIDLGNNDLIVNSPSTADSTTIQNQITAGVNGSTAQGVILSSLLTTGYTIGVAPAVGVADTYDDYGDDVGKIVDGQAVLPKALVARYTKVGDLNLDGVVNFSDFVTLVRSFNLNTGTDPAAWYKGDLNRDGLINIQDFSLLSNNFNAVAFNAPTQVLTGQSFALPLAASTSSGSVARWDVSWGDGTFDSYAGNIGTACHAYSDLGSALVQAVAVVGSAAGGYTTYTPPAVAVAVTTEQATIPLTVVSTIPTASYTVKLDAYGDVSIYNGSTFVIGCSDLNAQSISITGLSQGTVTVDESAGDPLPPVGMFTDAKTIDIADSSDAQMAFATATGVAVQGSGPVGATIRFPSGTRVEFDDAGPADTVVALAGVVTLGPGSAAQAPFGPNVVVGTGATVLFDGSQQLDELDVMAGGTARMLADGLSYLSTTTLSLYDSDGAMPGGLLDLADNDLIAHYADPNAIGAWLANGYDGGKWDDLGHTGPAPAAIISTVAANDASRMTGLGYAPAESVGPTPGTVDGQTVAAGDSLVRFTYVGDFNLDRAVDASDWTILDDHLNTPAAGWSAGDFNYDEVVDDNDTGRLNDAYAALIGRTPQAVGNADDGFPTSNLPATTPGGAAIASWRADFGDGRVVSFSPGAPVAAPVPNPFPCPSANYPVVLTALNAAGSPVFRYPAVSVSVDQYVPPPTHLVVVELSATSAGLSWDDSPAVATGYDVTVTDKADGVVWQSDASATDTACVVTGLVPGVQYTAFVTARATTPDGQVMDSRPATESFVLGSGGVIASGDVIYNAVGDSIQATATVPFSGEIATFMSTDLATDLGVYTAQIDWGDGQTGPGTIARVAGALFSVTGTHTYQVPDDAAPVLVTITDNQAGSDPTTAVGQAAVADHITMQSPTATLEDDDVTVDLSAAATDAGGDDHLTYTWSVVSGSSVEFDDNGDNAAQDTSAILHTAGSYTFRIDIHNSAGISTTADVTLPVEQVLSSLQASASPITISVGGSTTLSATQFDQFGIVMTSSQTPDWIDYDTYGYGAQITGNTYHAPTSDDLGLPSTTTLMAWIGSINSSVVIGLLPSTVFHAAVAAATASSYPFVININIPPFDGDGVADGIQELEVKSPIEPNFRLQAYTTGNSHQFVPICPGNFEFRLAFEAAGEITYSDIISADVPDDPSFQPVSPQTIVGAPSIPSLYPDHGTDGPVVKLVWSDESSNETGFEIRRYAGSSAPTGYGDFSTIGSVGADVASFVDLHPPTGVCVYYDIVANGETYPSTGDWSPVSIEFPTQPANLQATRNNVDGSVSLTWADPGPINNFGVQNDAVQWSSDGLNYYTIGTSVGQYLDDSPLVGGDKTNYYRIVATQEYYQYFSDARTFESTASAPIQVSVTAHPIAVDDTTAAPDAWGDPVRYRTPVGQALSVYAAADGVLANDVDPQGLTLHVDVPSVTQPAHGSVTMSTDGTFVYTPVAGFHGTDSFTYNASNGTVDSDPAEVDILVADRPVTTKPYAYHVTAGQTTTIPARDLGHIDDNPDGAAVTYLLAAPAAHGTVALASDGSFTYTPAAGFSGLDHFMYQVTDGYLTSNASVVAVGVGVQYASIDPALSDPNAFQVHTRDYPAALEGVWQAWNAAQGRLREWFTQLQQFGLAAQQCQTIDPTMAGTAAAAEVIDSAVAHHTLADRAFTAYTLERDAATTLCGQYLRTIKFWDQDDYNAEMAVESLPTTVLGFGKAQDQIQRLQAAFVNLDSGLDFVIANTTFNVEAAKATHAWAEHSLELAAGAGLVVVGIDALAEGTIDLCVQRVSVAIVKAEVEAKVGSYVLTAANSLLTKYTSWGLNGEQLQIAADAWQLFCFVKAARAARTTGCFAGDTPIETSAHGQEPIDDLRDGEKVLTSVAATPTDGGPAASVFGDTAVDPATWRQVELTMTDPADPGDSFTMQLLEPLTWIAANSATIGGSVDLNLPEMQITGDALVTSIDACPTIESGPGQVVLGTFQHVSHDVVDVSLVGENQPLQVTSNHQMWSLDAGGWVAAGDLRAGERLAGEKGAVIVASVTADTQSMPVYNLDIEGDHRYLVGDTGVLAHNTCPNSGSSPGEQANKLGVIRANNVATLTEGTVSGEIVSVAPYGKTDIDVVGGDGSLIEVGGPAKANNLGNTGRQLYALKAVAIQRGVPAKAYYTSDTPATVLDLAKKILGDSNVFTF